MAISSRFISNDTESITYVNKVGYKTLSNTYNYNLKTGELYSSSSSTTTNTVARYNFWVSMFGFLFCILLCSVVMKWTNQVQRVTATTTYAEYHANNIDSGVVHIQQILDGLGKVQPTTSLTEAFGTTLFDKSWGDFFNPIRDLLNAIYGVANFIFTGISAILQFIPQFINLLFG